MTGSRAVYAGVDGCRGGWLAVTAEGQPDGLLRVRAVSVKASFAALLSATAACAALAVDMPIGLSADGRRSADSLARRCLGPRRSSVFPAPPRPLLEIAAYAEANALSKTRWGRGVQRQAFNILPKIRELDALITPDLQERLVESHPEVSFWALGGEACLEHAKRSQAGREQRLRLLQSVFANVRELSPPPGAAWDDLYDACVLAWTAYRVAKGVAVRLPARPELDARGLRMEIVY